MASPYQQTPESDSESLLILLVKYNSTFPTLGRDHPQAIALRTAIDARIKAGEGCDFDKVTALLATLKKQYRGVRTQAGESHPLAVNAVANIALLTEILAREPSHLAEDVDAILKVKDNWISGVLYVPRGRFAEYAEGVKPDDTEFKIPKGSDDGLKVGMHLYVYQLQDNNTPRRWTPSGKDFVLGQVASVEPKQAQIRFLSSLPNNPLPTKLYCTQPGFNLGSLIITVRFDEEAWKNRPLMNAFLGDLLHNCSGDDLAKLNVLVTDTPRSECQIDLLPVGLGPKGHSEAQLRTLKALDTYVKEQPYLSSMKLNSVTSLENPASPVTGSLSPNPSPAESHSGESAMLNMGFRRFQLNALQGKKPEELPDWIDQLRKQADETEKASVAKANEVRDALTSKPPKSVEELEQLKAELRTAVDDAFAAKDRLQWMEFTALTLKVQTMLGSLNNRTRSRNEIVDRRVDDLLNPNYRWDSDSMSQESANASEAFLAESNANNSAKMFGSVTGQVTMRGKPITGSINFISPGRIPVTGGINEEGKYQIDFVQPGKYKVVIGAPIPAKFQSPTETPLAVEVVGGKNEFQFDLSK